VESKARIEEAAAVAATALAMVAAALWNGFPLMFFDSPGYLSSTDYTTLFRAPAYFWLARIGGWAGSTWLVIALQNVLLAYVLLRAAKAFGAWPTRRGATLAVMIGASLGLGATWTQSQLMADALSPTFVLALAVVVASERPSLADRAILVVVALGHFSHLATLAVVATAWLALAKTPLAPRVPSLRLAALLTIALGAVIPRASWPKDAGQGLVWQPFALGSLLEVGALVPMLEVRCPQQSLALCPSLDRLRAVPDAAYLLWAKGGPLDTLHGIRNHPEYRRMIDLALRDAPLEVLGGTVRRALSLSMRTTAGDRIEIAGRDAFTHARIEAYAPTEYPAFLGARQQTLTAETLILPRRAHDVVAATTLVVLATLLWRQRRRLSVTACGPLLVAVWCFFVNAFVCAGLSSVRDRYQARLYWVPLVVAAFVVLRREESVVRGSTCKSLTPCSHPRPSAP